MTTPLDAPSLHNVPIPWRFIDRVQMHPTPDQLSERELHDWLSAAGSPRFVAVGSDKGRDEPAAGGQALPTSSLQPAGVKSVRGALPAGLRRRVIKELWRPCQECHWHPHGRCVCPRKVTRNGSKCEYFAEAARQLNGHAGSRYTGGRGSRPWIPTRPAEVYP